MSVIFFITSLVLITIFIACKLWEDNSGKVIIKPETLEKSDVLIKKSVIYFDLFLNKMSDLISKIPYFLKKAVKGMWSHAGEHKDLVIKKISEITKSETGLNDTKDKGSVSLFLRTISDKEEGNNSLEKK